MSRTEGGTADEPIWLAYLLWAVPLVVLALLIWIVLRACGVTLLGFTLSFPWCSGPVPVVYALELETAREAALRHRIRDAELALMNPDNCAPRVAPSAPQERSEAQCAPTQTAMPPREIMLVLDASGSMQAPLNVPPELEMRRVEVARKMEEARSRGLGGLLSLPQLAVEMEQLERQIMQSPGPNRMEAAQQAINEAIDSAPLDASIGLMSFPRCGVVQDHGRYASGSRRELKRELRSIGPTSGTPLAAAVQRAAAALRGGNMPNDHVNIVVISDGLDSCGGDPCAVAHEVKARKPGLVINVVDLANSGELRCMAEATGGFYRRHDEDMDLSDLARAMREAAGYEGHGLCRN